MDETLREQCEALGLPTDGGDNMMRALLAAYNKGAGRKRIRDDASQHLFDMLEASTCPVDVLEQAEALLNDGANPNMCASDGCSIFHLAALEGNIQLLALLKRHGANVNVADLRGMTPLLYAANRGNWSTVHWLVENGADRFAMDHDQQNVLFRILLCITEENNEESYKCFASLLPAYEFTSDVRGDTLLHLACDLDDLRYAELLLNTKGACRVNQANMFKTTPLMVAADNRAIGPALIPLLLKRGAKIDAKDTQSHNPLVIAYLGGSVENMKALSVDTGRYEMDLLEGMLPYLSHPDPLGALRAGEQFGVSRLDARKAYVDQLNRTEPHAQYASALFRFAYRASISVGNLIFDCQDEDVWRIMTPLANTHYDHTTGETMLHRAAQTGDPEKLDMVLRNCNINPFLQCTRGETVIDTIMHLQGIEEATRKRMLASIHAYSQFCFTRQHAQWYGPYFVMRAYAFLLVLHRWKTTNVIHVPRDATLCILRALGNVEEK